MAGPLLSLNKFARAHHPPEILECVDNAEALVDKFVEDTKDKPAIHGDFLAIQASLGAIALYLAGQ